ncbi:NADP-dependent 3-hydroxy acid dehydrogenase YdfG [Chitinophaga sp. YR573]|uniref:oxidoreductase n=1 Tax=Chitinophaga sp. YR573 TaxID=1881040 RepID=UPI0008D35C80|nr:oxidoreductase [Chitinophaga sp. YR573]SEV88128.1 NADP-dependent 3-hydroxy acid dehydrogenase YdfG [Chitinophaga sp. YR573]
MENNTRKVWFITGASAGFGKSFAEYAIQQGYQVVVTARRLDKLESIKALAPDQVEALRMDVNNNTEVSQAVTSAVSRFGRVDVLINNAGYGIVGAVEETPEDELRAQMETNFFGAVSVTRALLPLFRQQQSGAIVNISSLGGQLSVPGFGAYSASKFALEGISEALAAELAPLGIKVLIVEPGQFKTELAGAAMRYMPELAAYKDTVGPTRNFAQTMHGTQEGDPFKAAAAIDKALLAANTPLRLQLGEDAVNAIKQHSENLLKDLAAWEQVAVDTKLNGSSAKLLH